MIKYSAPDLDRTFHALADPTRRAILSALSEREQLTVSELAMPFPVSLPAVMKHLGVLADAGLITRAKAGRTVSCRLAAAPMRDAAAWLARHERFWTESLDRLDALLKEDTPCSPNATPSNPSQASPSSAASQRPQLRSTRRGPILKN
jgi:DNA-binding transcriptional ArsR family regulator